MVPAIANLQARRAAYDLLARLYLEEPGSELAAQLRSLPGFAEHAPPEREVAAWVERLAIERQNLFGMQVYPYESIFVDHDLLLNTAAADRVAALYQACDFDCFGTSAGAPDHLGIELRLMSHLIGFELHAAACNDERGVWWARAQQARALRDHLAHWAPICAHTIIRTTREPLYTTLATLTTELVLLDLARVQGSGIGGQGSGFRVQGSEVGDQQILHPSAESLHPSSFILHPSEEPGINAIVRQLITPASVGVLLTRTDMLQIGRALDVPIARADRFQMLRGLFEAAGRFDQLLALLEALGQIFDDEAAAVAALVSAYPEWTAYGDGWRGRIAEGQALIAGLRAQAAGELRALAANEG